MFLFTENKQIPTTLQKEALKLQKSLAFDDEGGEGRKKKQENVKISIKFQKNLL